MGLRRVLRGNFSDSSWLCTLTSMRRNRPCQDRQPRQRDLTAEEGREEPELTGTRRGEAGAGSNQSGAHGPPTWPGQKLLPGVGAPLGHGGHGAGPRAPGAGRHAKPQHQRPCGQQQQAKTAGGFWKPRAPRQEVQSAPPARRTSGWCSSTPLSQQHTGTRATANGGFHASPGASTSPTSRFSGGFKDLVLWTMAGLAFHTLQSF